MTSKYVFAQRDIAFSVYKYTYLLLYFLSIILREGSEARSASAGQTTRIICPGREAHCCYREMEWGGRSWNGKS